MSYQLVNIHLGSNPMGGVIVNEFVCSEIVGSSHDLVKRKPIKCACVASPLTTQH